LLVAIYFINFLFLDITHARKKRKGNDGVVVAKKTKSLDTHVQGSSSTLPGACFTMVVSSPRTPSNDYVNDSCSDISSVIPNFASENYQRKDSASAREELLHNNERGNMAFQRIVLRQLAEMALKIDDIYNKIENMGAATEKVEVFTLPQPYDKVNTFHDFDETLDDRKQYKSLVKRLSSVGGNNAKKCVTNMVNRLMTNMLQSKFNLAGSKGHAVVKHPIEKLNVYKAIIDSVKRNFAKTTESEVRAFIASSLKYAPYRLDGGKRKTSEVGAILNAAVVREVSDNDEMVDQQSDGEDGDDEDGDDEGEKSDAEDGDGEDEDGEDEESEESD